MFAGVVVPVIERDLLELCGNFFELGVRGQVVEHDAHLKVHDHVLVLLDAAGGV